MAMTTSQLRNLMIEAAKAMPKFYTFKEIAEQFFRAGVIDKPENPYPNYNGSKYDYCLEKLNGTKNIEAFINDIVPNLFGSIDVEYSETETSLLVHAAKQAGYRLETLEEEVISQSGDPFIFDYRVLIPPSDSPTQHGENRSFISINSNYPKQINDLLEQLNGCLTECYFDAAALLMRRIVFL